MTARTGRRITAARVAVAALAVCVVGGALLAQWAAQVATDRSNQIWSFTEEPQPEAIMQLHLQQLLWAMIVPASTTLALAAGFGLAVIGSRALAVRWSHHAVERAARRAADHAADVADTLRPIRPPAR